MIDVNEHGLLVESVTESLDAGARQPVVCAKAGVTGRDLMKPVIETTYETVTIGAVQLRKKVVTITKPEPEVKTTPARVQRQKGTPAAKSGSARTKPSKAKPDETIVDEFASSEAALDPRAQGGDQK